MVTARAMLREDAHTAQEDGSPRGPAAAATATVIRDAGSLALWRRQLVVQLLPPASLHFQIPSLSGEENKVYTALANRLQRRCGCKSGGLLMSIAMVAMVLDFYASGHRLADVSSTLILSFVGIAVLSALIGKVLGLVWSRWRLVRLAGSIRDVISRSDPNVVSFEGS